MLKKNETSFLFLHFVLGKIMLVDNINTMA